MDISATFIYTSMLDGTLHGDMHAGNVLVGKHNISLIDFGICHTLPKGFMLHMYKLIDDKSFETIEAMTNMISVYPVPDVVNMETYEILQHTEVRELSNAIGIIQIIINIMIKHKIVIIADITLWLVQYTYLEKHMCFFTPPQTTFLFCVLQYICDQIPFRVNNPSVDVALKMLEKHEAQRILLVE